MPVIGGVDVYQLPMALRFTIVAIYCIIAASLLHSNPKLKNRQRLPLALIVVVGNAAMPLLFSVSDEICSFAVIALQLMWLASFKVRLFFIYSLFDQYTKHFLAPAYKACIVYFPPTVLQPTTLFHLPKNLKPLLRH